VTENGTQRKIVLYEGNHGGEFTGAFTDDNETFVIQQKNITGVPQQICLSRRQLEQILRCENVKT